MDAGLEHVLAAETILSDVNGAEGRLIIRGRKVEDLAAEATHEDAAHLLWSGFFADLPPASALAQRIGAARAATPYQATDADPVTALRRGWALVPDTEGLDTAIALTAAAPVLIAAAARARMNLPPLAPDATLSSAADFLRMLHGRSATPAEIRALNAYLVTICDHGLNASTFAARVVASTRAGLASAAIAGISALKGPLHGGAPGPVLDMLDAIAEPSQAEAWIDAALTKGERLMGFGHRIYRVRDPRADALKAALAHLPSTAGRLAFAEAVEQTALQKLRARHPARSLDINVEFYTALLLEALGIPRTCFTTIFAWGRSLGWIAHAKEQIATGRLVRPQSVYVGPSPIARRA
jgi:citrate synthase